MKVALIDPSLFTGPYDAALTEGLVQAGVTPTWVTRPTRSGDRQEIDASRVQPVFYRHVDDIKWLPDRLRTVAKGLAHVVGLGRMALTLLRWRPDVVHYQWVVLPPIDLPMMRLIQLFCPVVLTVHDTVAFNGEQMSWLQNLGFHGPIKLADHLIVHTQSGKDTLVRHGIPDSKISIVPHGPLPLHAQPNPARPARDPRYTFVLFGEMKPYKGIDVMVEAVGLLPPEVRAQTKVIVAGRERMDLAPIHARIQALGLRDTIEMQVKRLSEDEMADLFTDSDCFVFPYRQIDASGVYYLTKSFNKWMIASRVGIFAEDMRPAEDGELVTSDVPAELARAMSQAVTSRKARDGATLKGSWEQIGRQTREIYASLLATHSVPAREDA